MTPYRGQETEGFSGLWCCGILTKLHEHPPTDSEVIIDYGQT
jgi:hypothetical protein